MKCRVAECDLQERDEQEDHAAERRIGHQGEHGGGGELAGAEQLQRKHRVAAARLNGGKGAGGGQADRRGGDHRGGQAPGGLDQREARAGDGQHGERGAAQIQATSTGGIPGLWHPENCGDDDEGPQRQVDQENRTPRHRVGQVAADRRTDRGRDRGQARPRADRPEAVIGMKDRADDGKAPGVRRAPPTP